MQSYRHVKCDGQTDGQTPHGVYRAARHS